MPPPPPIKVLIVDDSSTVRSILSKILSKDPSIKVVATASDPYDARDKILLHNPDVLTLDLEMPKMDGLTFLKILMQKHPLPSIIISSLTTSGSQLALQAIESGAFDVLPKPSCNAIDSNTAPLLIEKIKSAFSASKSKKFLPTPTTNPQTSSSHSPPVSQHLPPYHPKSLILIGASTGGTEAIKDILVRLPPNIPPIAIVQHIPPVFSKSFADRLSKLCKFPVREAKHGDSLHPGLALLAPGDFHMTLHYSQSAYQVSLNQAPPIWYQRPAVDILFKSAVPFSGKHLIACLLTGMGKDGAEGLLHLKNTGAQTFAQNEASCVVYGMPKAAYDIGATKSMLPLHQFPSTILSSLIPVPSLHSNHPPIPTH